MAYCSVINCIDGRVQLPIINYMQQRFEVSWVDMITEPAPELLISAGTDTAMIESVCRRVDISVERHNSQIVALVAHHDCAGTDAPFETQLEQLIVCKDFLRKRWPRCDDFIFYVDENWQVNEVLNSSYPDCVKPVFRNM